MGFTVRQDYFTHFEPSQSVGGAKSGGDCLMLSRNKGHRRPSETSDRNWGMREK